MQSKTINTNNGWVFVFILDIWSDGTNTDAHSTDKDKSIVFIPQLTDISATDCLGTKFTLEGDGNIFACFADLYDCYLLQFSISMGWFSLSIILVGGSCRSPSSAQASSQSL